MYFRLLSFFVSPSLISTGWALSCNEEDENDETFDGDLDEVCDEMANRGGL